MLDDYSEILWLYLDVFLFMNALSNSSVSLLYPIFHLKNPGNLYSMCVA